MSGSLPYPWTTTTPQPSSTGPDFGAMSAEQVEAWKLDGMRRAIGRAFEQRTRYAIGSEARRALFKLVQAARFGYRRLSADTRLGFCLFEFESQVAEQIEAIAASRNVPPSVILSEIMQTAFWRYGIKGGIRVVSAGFEADMPGMIEHSDAPAEIEAAEPQAEDRPRILELAEVQATRIERDGAAYLRFALIYNGQTITEAEHPATITVAEANRIVDALLSSRLS